MQDIGDRRLTGPSNLKYKLAAMKETLNKFCKYIAMCLAQRYQKGDHEEGYSIYNYTNIYFGSV